MYSVALIECSERVVAILAEYFAKELHISLCCFDSFAGALGDLKKSHFQLIICRNSCHEEESAKQVLNYLYDHDQGTKVIVLGDLELSGFEFETLPDRFRIEELSRKSIRLLGISKEELEEIKLPDYIPFPLYHFYLMNTVPCDIFIKLGKDTEEGKFVKRIHSENEFDKDAIKKYEDQGLKCFYVQKDQRRLFMNSLVSQTLAKVDRCSSAEEIVEALADTYDIAKDLAVKTGIDTHSAQLIDGTVESMAGVVSNSPHFAHLFSTLLRYRGSLSYRHSYLIMLFAKKVLSNISWAANETSEDLYSSLVYMSFFHDIFLPDDRLTRIGSKEQMINAKLTEEEEELVLNHANLAATLIQKLPRAPRDIDVLIRQHHGMSNGVGFANAYSVSISKLSIVFIVVEDFVWRLIDFKKGEDTMSKIFTEMEKKFELPSYREIVQALKNSISST